MATAFVEWDAKKGDYRAIQNGQVIVRRKTQLEAALMAHQLRPNDTILAERVLHAPGGSPDKWRHMFGHKEVIRSGVSCGASWRMI